MPVISSHDLTKHYVSLKKAPGVWGSLRALLSREKSYIEAVNKVSFSIEQGELVGFLGPNGAGKTTAIKMLTGILYPTSGECKVLGYTPFERKPAMLRQIALVMGNRQQLWWDLPAWEGFVVLKELYDVDSKKFKDRIDFLLTTLQLTDKIHTAVRKLSLGERMKCELVAALLHSPKVLFLDEPTIGLDVVSQKRIRDFLAEMNREEGCTIILTSHYMQDVQELCKRVIVIDKGILIFDGSLEDLTKNYSDSRYLRLSFDTRVDPKELERYGQVIEELEQGLVLSVPKEQTAAITSVILQNFPVNDIAVESVAIEEVIRRLFTEKGSLPLTVKAGK